MAPFRHTLSYFRSLFFTAPLIILYTIVMASLSVFSSVLDSRGRLQHGCSRIWSKMILWTSGVRTKVFGIESLETGVPYVLCANHQSYMDIPILLAAFPFQFRFAAKKELFRVPFLGWHLRRSGHVPIDRENPHTAVKALREATEKIRTGTPVLIFPEGRTSRDGSVKPFKGGGFMLATKSGAAVVPVTIRGSRNILRADTYHIRGGTVEVFISKAIAPDSMSADQLAKLVEQEIRKKFNA